MKIERIKINGVKNPVGYNFEHLNLSYVIEGVNNEKHIPRLIIYNDKKLTSSVFEKDLDIAHSFCEMLDFMPEKETRYFFIIKYGDFCSEVCYFETGTDFDCGFITPAIEISHPVLFTEFPTSQKIESARLYITGVGLYEAHINGKKVGNEYLAPYCNDYDNALQYQTYDVTEDVKEQNKLEVFLGDGWYKGRFGLRKDSNIFGSGYAVAAKLIIKDNTGKVYTLVTDEKWKARMSATVSSGIYDGEITDDTIDTSKTFAVKFSEKKFNVIPRISIPVVCKCELKPELIISPKGEQILDFKQNMAGVIRFETHMKRGQKITLKVGEVLQQGCFYNENLRTAKAEFVYTSDGVQKTVKQHFTYYGFRYVLVEGIEKVNPEDFTVEVIYSDIEDTVEIQTDNDKINRLLANCKWGQYSNFVDVPTDCPQRDERLGWTGDAQVFSKAACFQADCKAFYDKFLYDIAVDQKILNGAISMYSPSVKETLKACSVWSDAATIIPWNLYCFYGDKTLLEKHFPMMEAYVETLIKADDEHGGRRLQDFSFELGDWLSQDGATQNTLKGATDDGFIATMYYYHSVRILSDAAGVLSLDEKQRFLEKIKSEIYNTILNEYFTPNGRLSIDTQTAYSLCVNFGVYRDRKKLIDGFRARIKKDGYAVKGGFVGATQLIQSLIECGLNSEAFRILYSENYPSWLYCVNLGATTIWERWNSLGADGTISSTGMNSFNHYSFGAVAEAFYSYIAGLKCVTQGFKSVEIKPVFDYRLKKLDFTYNSLSGTYVINYRIEKDGKINLYIEIPFGCTALLKIADCESFEDRTLQNGIYEFMLRPDKDYFHPFSIETSLSELLTHQEAVEIIKNIAPNYFYYFSTTDSGMKDEPLSHSARFEAFRIPEDKLKELDLSLRRIEK